MRQKQYITEAITDDGGNDENELHSGGIQTAVSASEVSPSKHTGAGRLKRDGELLWEVRYSMNGERAGSDARTSPERGGSRAGTVHTVREQ